MRLGQRLKLGDPNQLGFLWVIDFPLVIWNEDGSNGTPTITCSPRRRIEYLDTLESDPGSVKSKQYDLVCNGFEVARRQHPNSSPRCAGACDEADRPERWRRRARSLATCWMRLSMARRRMAASRPASIAWPCCIAARQTCAK